jgi:NADH-quinone oxidoreductase subunit C
MEMTPPPAAGAGSRAVARLRERHPTSVLEVGIFRGEETVIVQPRSIVEVCRFLKEEPALAFHMLSDLCGVHFLDRDYTYEVVYQLYSFKNNRRLRLKVRLGKGETVPSVTVVWPGADWLEREAYDLVGIRFEGHPDLRRILMPEDYDEHPLRRDFPLSG